MFYTKRIKGLAKFITDEEVHKKALQNMSKTGIYEFEFISDSIEDIIAVSFSVAEGTVGAEKESLFEEFYKIYWEMADEIRKSLR